jgi:hypothetical protein
MPELKKDHGKLFKTADEVETPEEAAITGNNKIFSNSLI